MPIAVDVWARTFLLFFSTLWLMIQKTRREQTSTSINKKSFMMITDYAKINLVKEFIERSVIAI